MEAYNQIKKDIFNLVVIATLIVFMADALNIGTDSTDKDGWNRSGFKLLKDYGTGKEYLYRNGALIERGK